MPNHCGWWNNKKVRGIWGNKEKIGGYFEVFFLSLVQVLNCFCGSTVMEVNAISNWPTYLFFVFMYVWCPGILVPWSWYYSINFFFLSIFFFSSQAASIDGDMNLRETNKSNFLCFSTLGFFLFRLSQTMGIWTQWRLTIPLMWEDVKHVLLPRWAILAIDEGILKYLQAFLSAELFSHNYWFSR